MNKRLVFLKLNFDLNLKVIAKGINQLIIFVYIDTKKNNLTESSTLEPTISEVLIQIFVIVTHYL